MKTSFEYRGYWYLPESPNDKIAGTLIYKPYEEVKLELIGSFQDPIDTLKSFDSEDNKYYSIIHGETSDAKKISLLDCHVYGSYNFDSSFAMMNFNVKYVLEGIYLNDKKDKRFYSIQTTFPLLDKWVNFYKVKQAISFNLKNEIEKIDISFFYSENQNISHFIDSNTTIDFKFHCDFSTTERAIHQLKQITYCEINSQIDLNFSDLIESIYRFKSLVSFATFSHFDFDFIQLYSNTIYQQLENGKKIEKPIKIYYRETVPESTKQKDFYKFLFNYQEISSIFAALIINWYQVGNDFTPIRHHLIESIIPKRIFKSGDFLIVIQALEGFHRRFRNQKDMSLKTRLKELGSEFSSIKIFKTFTINYDQAVVSRNYYSHFFKKSANVLSGVELLKHTRSLRVLLICCVLQEMGFELLRIDELMDKNKFSI